MTLTTERQQFEEWFTNKYPRSYWGVEKTASGEYQGGLAAPLWEAWQESSKILANREAQPVALVDRRPAASGGICWQHDGKDLSHGTELFTAPPAPAKAQIAGYFVRHRSAWDKPSKWRLWTECSAEDYAEFCKIIATGEADAGQFYGARILYDAPPAPAVPDALEKMRSIVADPRALPRRKEWISGQQYSYVLLENVEAMVDEACRTAMLNGGKS